MAQLIKGNYNALTWLQDELQQSLRQALNAVNSYIDEADNDKALLDCSEALYQVNGTLEMLNLNGAAQLTEEMQQTIGALRERRTNDHEQAQDALVRSLLLLPNYLLLLGDSFHDHPLSLLESINELRLARSAELLTEESLFKPALTVGLPASITPNPHRKIPEIDIELSKLTHAFLIMLLSWLRNHDEESLRKMRGVVHYLRLTSREEKTTLLWWAAEGLLEALSHHGLPISDEIKRILGKLVTPVNIQSKQSETELLVSFPTPLLTSLLLLVAKAESHGPQVTLLKTIFDLHFFDQKKKIYGMSDNALSDAHQALYEQLQDLKEQLNQYDQAKDENSDILDAVTQQLHSMSDTLALLTEYEASNLLHHQVEKLQALLEQQQQPDEDALSELSDVLLQVENFIQASSEEINERLRSTVIKECLLEMANIKETLTLMSRGIGPAGGLDDILKQLQLIAGSLNMLDYPHAATVLEDTADKIREHTDGKDPLTPAQLTELAYILSCCDIFMEGVQQHGYTQSEYLQDASDRLAGFDSLPEQAEAEAQAIISQDDTLAELDSLLDNDELNALIVEAEPAQAQNADMETLQVSTMPADTLPSEQTTLDALPPEEQWQFADDIDAEIAAIFVEEASEVITELDTLIPQWVHDENQDVLQDIRRYFHTLKGSGRMAGARVISELAWAVEQVLNHVLDGTRPQTPQVMQLANQALGLLPSLLIKFTHADMRSNHDVEALITLKDQCLARETAAPATEAQAEQPVPVPSVTSVEQYILRQQAAEAESHVKPSAVAETSVERYIQAQQSKAAHTLEAETPTAKETLPLTSVDRYLIRLARQHGPLTSVEYYIQNLEATATDQTEASASVETELSEQDELQQIFTNEAQQHIASLQQAMATVEQSRKLNKDMLRAIHSLKGCANIAGATPMALLATDLDQAMRRLHAQDITLDSEQLELLTATLQGLQQILHGIIKNQPEPDIRQLSDNISKLKPEAVEQTAPVIDPELLVVFLEEMDDLLDSYSQQLGLWRQQPQDEDNLNELMQTLSKLNDTATQAQQPVIAELFASLSQLISQTQPETQGLEALLEDGYEQLNEHIENLLQNKPVNIDGNFDQRVSAFLQTPVEEEAAPTQVQAEEIDETEFPIPADADAELLSAFTEEAQELLTSSGQAIKDWQTDPLSGAASQQLQRDLHTLKGGSRLTGIKPMADLTHHTESLVLGVIDKQHPADEEFFDLLVRCQDKLTEMQEQLAANQAITTAVSLISEIALLSGQTAVTMTEQPAELETTAKGTEQKAAVPAHVEQVRVRADLLDYLSNFAGEVSISRDRITQQHTALHQQLREMEETVARLHDQLRKLEIETETQILFRYEDDTLNQDSEFDPLELDRFSMIQQLSRSLTESVIDLNDISRSMDALVRETDVILLQQSRLNTDLQHGLMNTRLLPFSGVEPRLERIVRQTAAELDKKAVLQVYGADLELDRAILDRLVAPMEHILRNAVAHGIETPQQRSDAGKSETGTLQLHLQREGSEMLLTLSDDGRGIDTEKVKQKALALNLISEQNVPSDDELIQLILTSGFSTADSISQVAGRGVGMDVVSNEIRNLKGRLSIQSRPGQGTTFTIRLPLTLSVIQILLVSVQDEQYAIPLGSVNAGERINVGNIKLLLESNNPQYQFNGEQYQFMPLSLLLDKGLSLPDNLKQQMPLLLFRSGDMRIALLVDDIISNREVVIKPVGQQLGHISAINGATILGDGRVVFILDIPTLIESSGNKVHMNGNDASRLEQDLEHLQDRTPIALVVDDSITMRKASSNLLNRLGFDVMTARDGIDALAQLHNHKPDIILLDVEMPRMDGFEFASIVRNEPNFRHLPIIMITSRTGAKHRDRAMGIGVNAYLGKPYQEEELVENMKKLLGSGIFHERH